jgi:hypothetical protein
MICSYSSNYNNISLILSSFTKINQLHFESSNANRFQSGSQKIESLNISNSYARDQSAIYMTSFNFISPIKFCSFSDSIASKYDSIAFNSAIDIPIISTNLINHTQKKNDYGHIWNPLSSLSISKSNFIKNSNNVPLFYYIGYCLIKESYIGENQNFKIDPSVEIIKSLSTFITIPITYFEFFGCIAKFPYFKCILNHPKNNIFISFLFFQIILSLH